MWSDQAVLRRRVYNRARTFFLRGLMLSSAGLGTKKFSFATSQNLIDYADMNINFVKALSLVKTELQWTEVSFHKNWRRPP